MLMLDFALAGRLRWQFPQGQRNIDEVAGVRYGLLVLRNPESVILGTRSKSKCSKREHVE